MLLSNLESQLSQPIEKQYVSGTVRTLAPEQTLKWIEPHLAGMGITRVANVTGLDKLGVPVVMVCRPNSRSVAVSQGKGLTLAAARASGLMETIELHHAERICAPLRFASAAEMSKHLETIDLGQLPRIRNHRPHDHLRLLWIEGYDLIQRRSTWVPYEIVSIDSSAPVTPGGQYFASTSNGLASGNHLIEAIIHGICEVIERDATTLWYLSDSAHQASTRVELSSIDDNNVHHLLNNFTIAGVETMIWQTTSDVGLPAFLCLITDCNDDPTQTQYTSAGYGCHLSRRIALLRALTEAAQSRLTLISGSRDDVFRGEYEPVSLDEIRGYRSLTPGLSTECRFSDIVSYEHSSFQEDLETLLRVLQNAGISRAIVVDLTAPDIEIPVVRVIIPGLEGPIPGVHGPRAAAGYTPGIRAQRLLRRH